MATTTEEVIRLMRRINYISIIFAVFISVENFAQTVVSNKNQKTEEFSSAVYPGEWAELFTSAIELFNVEVGKNLKSYQIECSIDNHEYVIAFIKKNSLKASIEYPSYYVISNKDFEIKSRIISKGRGNGLLKLQGDGRELLQVKGDEEGVKGAPIRGSGQTQNILP